MEDTIKIVINSNSKTKSGKSCLNFAYEEKKKSDFRKGYVPFTNWFDSTELFEKIDTDEHIGKILEATYTYVPGYSGTATLQLLEIFDENGSCILS